MMSKVRLKVKSNRGAGRGAVGMALLRTRADGQPRPEWVRAMEQRLIGPDRSEGVLRLQGAVALALAGVAGLLLFVTPTQPVPRRTAQLAEWSALEQQWIQTMDAVEWDGAVGGPRRPVPSLRLSPATPSVLRDRVDSPDPWGAP